ncbi:MAG: PAS domain S-box protein [Nitrospirota bacterium]|nr:PAS domain S-box protein [Nitrospirota bacterium]
MQPSERQQHADLLRENKALRQRNAAAMQYIRRKVDQLLTVMGTSPLRAEELDDNTLIELDPIGIVSDSFVQVLHHLKETNDQLKTAHDEITAIFKSAGMGILVIDRDLRVLAYNRKIQEQFCVTQNVKDSVTCREILCQTVKDENCPARQAIRSGTSVRREMDLAGRRFDMIATPIQDKQGAASQVVLVYMDLTDRIQAQEDLRRSEERYRDLFENATDLIQVLNSDGSIQYVNHAWQEALGYRAEDLVGMSIFDVIHPDCTDCGPEFKSVVCGHKGGRFETLFITKARRTLVVEGNVSPIVENGVFVGTRGIFRDITERKRSETTVAAEREQLAVTLRSIGDGVITTDINARVVLINKVAEHLTGWRQDEAVGRTIQELFPIKDERTGADRVCPVEKVLQTGTPCELEGNAVLVARDGARHLITDSVAPIRDRDSNVSGAVLVFRDVTERKKLENRLIKSEKIESLGVLAGGIAHDFNNLLNSIIANIDIATRLVKPDSDVQQSLQRAQKASTKAKELTQQLLTFSKGGAPVKRLASIADLIRDTADFGARGTNVRCQYDFAPDLWNAEVDEGQISQVIQNLVINAVQAMPQGGTIEIAARNLEFGRMTSPALGPGHYVMITVRDHGHGIPPENLNRIFEPYFTTKSTGSGLGLATTYSIVKKHDGAIDVESSLGNGTIFSLYLPATLAAAAPVERSAAPLPRQEQSGRILVMDDDELVRETAGVLLDLLGYQADFAVDGERALELYQQAQQAGAPFDAVIMDLTIPGGKGGLATIRQLLKIDPQARAIVSSGYSTDAVMANYSQHGFSGIVVKPYTLDELGDELQRVLGKK